MKQPIKDGLSLGVSLWIFSKILGIFLGFLQMGYIPSYLLQLIFAIALLVRCCKKSSASSWIGLATLEGLVLINALVHYIRSLSMPGFTGFAMLVSGIFGGGVFVILGVISLALFLYIRRK